MSKKIRPSKEWLEQKYLAEHMSAEAVSAILGAAECTVFTWLRYYDIPRKKETVEYNNRRYGDKTGECIGLLTVLGRDTQTREQKGRFWLCRCDCGKELSIHSCSLNHTKSCGCLISQPEKRLEGQRFGHILVVRELARSATNERVYECQCDCGKTWGVLSSSLRAGRTTSCGCSVKRRKGKDHYLWDSSKTVEERSLDRRLNPLAYQWRTAVFKRDQYKCQVSGYGGSLAAHHIIPWKASEELRFDIDNGITLRTELHTLFHRLYGYRDNTQAQMEDFTTKYKTMAISDHIFHILCGRAKSNPVEYFRKHS